MVTELRLFTIEGNFLLHIYHIAGTRMIASGIDGLSRGELHVSSLETTVQTIMPLHLSPIDRSPLLREWLCEWLDPHFKIAEPSFLQIPALGLETRSNPGTIGKLAVGVVQN